MLTCERLGKRYRLYGRPIDSLKEWLSGKAYGEAFWALRNITFSLERGQSLGVVGDNGAGKSTLLRVLTGLSQPTEGVIHRGGRLSALLSLGAGFHPDLSGAENIRIGCAVMGLSPAETDRLLPAIVEFSELGAFIGRPVRTYSSGMSLRLGFSVATAVDPEILLVDEHLSVGDQHFRHKCMRRILSLQASGCSLIFCSHDLHALGEVCARTLWLRSGEAALLGPTAEVLNAYQDHVRERDGKPTVAVRQAREGQRAATPMENAIESVALSGTAARDVIETGDVLALDIVLRVTPAAEAEGVRLGVLIVRNDMTWCFGVTTDTGHADQAVRTIRAGVLGVRFVVDRLPLLSGEYSFTVALMDVKSPHVYDSWTNAAPFTVRHHGKDVGLVRIEHRWDEPRS